VEKTQSADGTTIAYDVWSSGPLVVIVGGAFNNRHTWVELAQEFSAHGFRAVSYDRRGRGDSTIMGGADTIRQALAGGHVDELFVTIAPVVLGGGKRLFEGFNESIDLQQVEARQSEWATHLPYRVKK
jgi:dihydrofolate reductase